MTRTTAMQEATSTPLGTVLPLCPGRVCVDFAHGKSIRRLLKAVLSAPACLEGRFVALTSFAFARLVVHLRLRGDVSTAYLLSLSTTGELLVGHLSSSDGEGVRRTMRVGAGADRALGHADTIRAFGSRQRLSLMMCHHQKKLYLLMFCVKTRRQT